mmetsp:Transcript_26417/g.52641  ORF Transcript_26417/g.52641 Transcript_26417/m.52641 type:complete len:228 (+) Transcript_26417:145-828(+)
MTMHATVASVILPSSSCFATRSAGRFPATRITARMASSSISAWNFDRAVCVSSRGSISASLPSPARSFSSLDRSADADVFSGGVDPPQFRRQIQEAISSKEYYRGLCRDQDRLPCGILTKNIRYKLVHLPQSTMAPHVSPGEHKVVLKIYMSGMIPHPIENEYEKAALLELVGARFNTSRDELTLVSEKFPSRIENKRYLEMLLDTLITSAKSLASEQLRTGAPVSI